MRGLKHKLMSLAGCSKEFGQMIARPMLKLSAQTLKPSSFQWTSQAWESAGHMHFYMLISEVTAGRLGKMLEEASATAVC